MRSVVDHSAVAINIGGEIYVQTVASDETK